MDRGEPDQVMSDVVDIVAGLTGALGVAFVSRDSSQRLTINPQHYAPRQIKRARAGPAFGSERVAFMGTSNLCLTGRRDATEVGIALAQGLIPKVLDIDP